MNKLPCLTCITRSMCVSRMENQVASSILFKRPRSNLYRKVITLMIFINKCNILIEFERNENNLLSQDLPSDVKELFPNYTIMHYPMKDVFHFDKRKII